MNLKQFEMEDAGVLHLRDAGDQAMYASVEGGEPLPVKVHLYGPGSQQHAKATHARATRLVDLLKKGKQKESIEESTLANARFLTACTKRWENVESDTGATGDDLSMEIYTNPRLSFIRDQVAGFISETANFTKGSSKP
jgi:hypothetical protein